MDDAQTDCLGHLYTLRPDRSPNRDHILHDQPQSPDPSSGILHRSSRKLRHIERYHVVEPTWYSTIDV